jgi:translation initiation factor 2 beta subunit (eIF-2beta)/eIF-5
MLKISSQRAKDEYEAEIKRLKGLLEDKAAECESISRNAKREVELVQQENERIKVQVKTVIEKKNDELFHINRDKDAVVQEVKKGLETSIEELKYNSQKEVDALTANVQRL